MIDSIRLEKYAKLAIKKGVNLQQGQTLLINASVDAVDLTRACVKEAYLQGARKVLVFYNDDINLRADYEYQSLEALLDIHSWQIDCKLDYFKEGGCILHIASTTPGVLKGIDADKISQYRFAMANANKEAQEYTMNNKAQWCIVAVPNPAWAKLVFPELDEVSAMDALWEQILSCVHVRHDNDPLAEWDMLNESFVKRVTLLNEFDFDVLHFQNAAGTDLKVQLAKHHIWAGGSENTVISNVEFQPNMPTEEIFTMPDRCGVNGKVFASRPLDYNGTLIENFWLEFKDGKVVNYDAKSGKEALKSLIEFDEGSCRLGEVALVPYDSPISQSQILFYNTLFDENASCHLALGNCYASNLQGGLELDDDALKAAGGNISLTHVDFMFGTQDMLVIGIQHDGSEVVVFENGNFIF